MASFFNQLVPTLSLLLISIVTFTATTTSALLGSSRTPTRPKAIYITISKDTSTSQYTTNVFQRTPPLPIALTLDLGTQHLWLNCGRRHVSSTYQPVKCGSPLCAFAKAKICRSCPSPPGPKPGCNNNTCRAIISNPITNRTTTKGSELAIDVIQANSSNGVTIGGLVAVPKFLYICAPTSLLGGLAKGVHGVAGFGRNKASFPTQFYSTFGLAQVFALCLPRFSQKGFAILGEGPFTKDSTDLRSILTYTPLITNPIRTSEYFIGVQGIKIGEEDVPINKSLLSFDKNGNGGTTISLSYPYTALETSIFKAVTTVFDKYTFPSKRRVTPVAPFEFCYDTFEISRAGILGPSIHLVLHSEDVVLTITASNSLVWTNNVYCLGIVDGGNSPKSSIVIGGYQIENNLLQFNRAKSMLGFSYLSDARLGCSQIHFTSNV